MNLLQTDRLASAARKLFGIQQSNAPLPTLAIELQAVWDMAHDDRIASSLCHGWELCWGGGAVPAVALNAGWMGVRNPAGSGKVCVVEKIQGVLAAIQVCVCFITTELAVPLAITVSGRRDSRRALGAGTPPVFVGGGQTVGALVLAGTIGQITIPPNNVFCDLDVVLMPGTSLLIGPNVINTQVHANLFYRIRELQPGEQSV